MLISSEPVLSSASSEPISRATPSTQPPPSASSRLAPNPSFFLSKNPPLATSSYATIINSPPKHLKPPLKTSSTPFFPLPFSPLPPYIKANAKSPTSTGSRAPTPPTFDSPTRPSPLPFSLTFLLSSCITYRRVHLYPCSCRMNLRKGTGEK
jgi:hypothetical protein